MLNIHNPADWPKMKNYYRANDMLNLLTYFPKLSPVRDLTIVESIEEFENKKSYFASFSQNRVDTLKGHHPINNIENSSNPKEFLNTLMQVKAQDPSGVLILFNLDCPPSARYERYAGIAVGIDLGLRVVIDAVSQGFDGREVSKSICTHERYLIPWTDLRKVSITNFKEYQTYQITDEEYLKTREERIKFLTSIGLNPQIFTKYIPIKYQPIPDFIWLDILQNLIKKLDRNEEILREKGFTSFAISGHTEGKRFAPWQMYDKSRFF